MAASDSQFSCFSRAIGNENYSEWQKFRKIMFFQKLFHPIVEKHANCSRDCALTCKSYQFISLFSDEGTTYDFLCSPTWLVGTWHALPDQISAPSWSLYTEYSPQTHCTMKQNMYFMNSLSHLFTLTLHCCRLQSVYSPITVKNFVTVFVYCF